MKQSTFSAQVATNLLNVLQGYTKGIRFVAVLTMLLIVGVGQAWGATETITADNGVYSGSGNNAIHTWTLTSCTVVQSKGNGSSAVNSTYPNRWYQGHQIKFTPKSGYTITKIVLVGSGSSYNGQTMTASVGTIDSSSNTTTWDGNITSSSSVTLTMGKQFRFGSVTITYTAGGGGSTPTLTVDKTSLAFGNVATDSNKELDFTLTGSNLTANASLQLSGTNESMFSVNPTSVTQSAGSINNQTITVTYTPTAAGEHTATLTISSTGAESKTVALSGTGTAPAAKYTVTFNAGSGTCDDESLTETSGGAGVTLPIATPSATCQSEGWTFAGWAEASVATETEEAPTTLYEAGDIYKPTSNITLYAVYQRTEGGGGTVSWNKITTAPADWSGEYLIVNSNYAMTSDFYSGTSGEFKGASVTVSNNQVTSSPSDKMIWIVEKNGSSAQYSFKNKSTGTYAKITGTSSTNAALSSSVIWFTISSSSTSGVWKINSVDNSARCFAYYSTNKTFRTYANSSNTTGSLYKKEGGGSTTYYHSTPDCGSTASTYTLTLQSGLSCVTNGSATVELNATELTNFIPATRDGFTCSGYWSAPSGGVKVLNADGTFAATSIQDYITDGKWTNEGNVTLTPRWECSNTMTLSVGTQSGGTYSLSKTSLETCDCTDNKRQVTITATPNSGYSVTDISYSGDGTATKVSGPTVNGNDTKWVYQFNQGDNGDGIFTVTFTTIPTYTVTWNNNGDTTSKNYNHGETLEVPTAPASCDGVKEFVGWTAQGGYAHSTAAPADLFTESSGTVTADATYYAVYAEGSGAGGTGWTAVTSTSDLEAGATYAISNAATGGTYLSTYTGGNNFPGSTSIICPLILGGSAGAWTFQIADGGTYNNRFLTAASTTSNNYLKAVTTADDYSVFSISFDAINKNAVITCTGKASRNILRYNANSGSPIFACYSSGQSPVYLQKLTGGGGYTNYTTSCATITDIRIEGETTTFNQFDPFEFGGTVYAIDDEDHETDVTELATFTGYDMSQVGEQTVTVTYLGRQATYTITVNEVETWHITWNVSGATNTGIGPRYVAKGKTIGECSRTGDIQIPAVPTGCTGKTFIGWTESNTVPENGVGIAYINKDTKPDSDKTYYAVFATVHNVCTRQAIEDIADGSKVVIVAGASVSGTSGKAISSRATMDTHNLAGDEVTIDGNQITTPHVTCLWIINKVSEGVYRFEQNGKYLNGIIDGTFSNLKYLETKDSWNVKAMSGKSQTYTMESKNAEGEYIEWYNEKFTIHDEVNTNGEFDMQFYLPADLGSGSHGENYTTGCHECTITYYGFSGGYSTQCGGDDLNSFTLPVNSAHTIPNCGTITDPSDLKREFLGIWNTKPHGGKEFKPGDTFILTQDTTFYAQWKLETDGNITLPTDLEDLAGTDIYVYGGTTLNIQPGTTTINSLTLKGGLQADGSYKMPTVWVPEGATLVRNSNKIYLDLVVNAKNYYPFAVPFAAKNKDNIDYLDPVLNAASTYDKHFVIKTYDGARRAEVGEDKAKNWVKVLRETSLQPGVGYIITALTYPDKDTATIRIPMTVPNTWFENGEQAEVGSTVRNTIAVTAHTGPATDINNGGHQRHAGWNFVANPYLTSFAGGNIANDGDLAYINGQLIIEGSYEYGGENVPYVTVPAYDFAYYSQHKLSDVKLSPEWSFFVQVGTGGTMNFTTAGRQQAPASIAARNAEERPMKMDVDLILSDNHSSDQTGIIISDRYTDAYEIGRDLEKLFGSAYNLSVYTLMEDNTPLAFQALAIRSSMQVIPVGYRAPEQGEYTFRLNEATSSIDLLNEQYEQLVLVDYQTGELTNLLYTDYTFYSERTQSNSRFAIYAVPRQNAPTDLPNAIGSDEEVRKVIYNDHLYILRDGNVYNGMGQKM